jgi:hypothetical protein
LRGDDVSKYVINLPLETFSISASVKPEKSATLPLQIANDFDTPGLNRRFYEWQLARGTRHFIEEANSLFGDGGSSEIAGKIKLSLDELDINTGQMALLDKWVKLGGDVTYLPFKRSVRNTLKRQLIDKAGLFTPVNTYGSQSVMVPDWSDYGTSGHLRNTLFKTEWSDKSGNTKDISKRDIWTYGQIEMDATNKSKLVNVDNVRFIEHNCCSYKWS